VPYRRLLGLLRQMDAARVDLMVFLDALGRVIGAATRALRAGRRLGPYVRRMTAVHVQLLKRLDAMHHSVSEARAETVRLLVDHEGMSVAAVARLMGRPRQIVSRLYHHASKRNGERRTSAAPRRTGGVSP
jgi:hypothetical protein